MNFIFPTSEEDAVAVCTLYYYDWEGNETRRKQNPAAAWDWKSLVIDFGYVAIFEYSAPDFLNRAHETNEVEFGNRLDELKLKERGKLKEFSGYRSPLLDGNGESISIKFNTQNWMIILKVTF